MSGRVKTAKGLAMISLRQWLKILNCPARVGGRLRYASRARYESGDFELYGQGCVVKIKSHGVQSKASDGDLILLGVDRPPVAGIIHLSGLAEIEIVTKTSTPPQIFSNAEIQKKWFHFLRDIEEIFDDLGLLRVTTPTRVKSNGLEPSIEPIASEDLFLPTSPELALKKILSHDFTDIYEIRACFRKETPTPHHLSEFTMIEWYRGFADLRKIENDIEVLIQKLFSKNWHHDKRPLQKMTMAEVFQDALNFELKSSTTQLEIQNCLREHGQHFQTDWNFDDSFNALFVTLVEPYLKNKGPLLIGQFPPSQAALARINQDGWAERVELYWNGLELANGYDELVDPVEQRVRFNKDIQKRKLNHKIDLPIDEDFLAALTAGLPPTAGIALGLERLFMACVQLSNIQDLKFFN